MSLLQSLSGLIHRGESAAAPVAGGRLPNTNSVASLPREERRSASRLAKFFYDQYQAGLRRRRRHAEQWIRITSIMSGIHYFEIRNGMWIPKAKRRGQIRATTPLMVRVYRREMGRLGANDIGVTATPRTGQDLNSDRRANRAQAILDHWLDETRVQDVDTECNGQLTWYGTCGLYRMTDAFRRNVFVQPVPGPELFPIPFDARNWRELDGILIASLRSQQWLEMQDDLFERQEGHPPARRMARAGRATPTRLHADFTGFASARGLSGRMQGATCLWIWMRKSPLRPTGEHFFMVEDELFGALSGADERGRSLALPDGDLPVELIYYQKNDNDFWGYGLLEHQIGPQKEANRQYTRFIKKLYNEGGFLGYNSEFVDNKDIQSARESGLVPFRNPGYDQKIPPLIDIKPGSHNPGTAAMFEIIERFSNDAAGHESDVIRGRAEGRIEGGPAVSLLNANAQAPLEPTFDSKFNAWKRTLPHVLDRIGEVWPETKAILVQGRQNLGREILIRKDQIPDSHDVKLTPTPMVPNGRTTLANMIFQLRSLPGDDGKGFLLKEHEVKNGLRMLRLNPPGIDLIDKREQRVRWRIAMLINDGRQPALAAAGTLDPRTGRPAFPEQESEDHLFAIQLFRDAILDPAFHEYSPAVQQGLRDEMRFHQQRLALLRPPDNVDDAAELADSAQVDNQLEAAEQNPFDLAGLFAPGGIALGA